MSSQQLEVAEKRVSSEALELTKKYGAIAIKDQKSYNKAVEGREIGKQMLETIDEYFEDMRADAYQAYQTVLNKRSEAKGPVQEFLKHVNKEIGRWTDEQEAAAAELQAAAEEKAREEAEQRRKREVARAKKKGLDDESVAAIEEAPLEVAEVNVKPTYEKAAGISTRDKWECEVTNIGLAIKYIAKNFKFLGYLAEINMAEANKLARTQRTRMDIPGLKAVRSTTVADKPKRRSA